MKNKKLLFKSTVIITLFAMLFTGCGKKKDYNVGNENNSQDKVEIQTFEYENSFEIAEGDNAYAVVMDADVYGNRDGGVGSVIQYEEIDMDEKYKEQIAKKFFGSNPVYYYSIEKAPKAKVQREIDSYEEELQFLQEEEDNDYKEENIESTKETLERLYSYYETAPEDFELVDEYDTYEYIGVIDGLAYLLRFESYKDEKDSGLFFAPKVWFGVFDDEDFLKKMNLKPGHSQELMLTTADARKLAEDYILTNEIADGKIYIKQNGSMGSESEDTADDYEDYSHSFVFKPYIDTRYEISMFNSYREYEINIQTYNNKVSMVSFTTDKIVEKNDDVELLPFDDIVEAVKKEMNDNSEKYITQTGPTGDLNMNSILFSYAIVRDDDIHYTVLPCWQFGFDIVVNAIDGSILHYDR